MDDFWTFTYLSSPVLLVVVTIGMLVWVVSLYRKLKILRYCYIDLSDWIANHLKDVYDMSKWMVHEFFVNNEILEGEKPTEEQIDNEIYDDIRNWEKLWGEKVDFHFKIMKRNNTVLPSEGDKGIILLDWFK